MWSFLFCLYVCTCVRVFVKMFVWLYFLCFLSWEYMHLSVCVHVCDVFYCMCLSICMYDVLIVFVRRFVCECVITCACWHIFLNWMKFYEMTGSTLFTLDDNMNKFAENVFKSLILYFECCSVRSNCRLYCSDIVFPYSLLLLIKGVRAIVTWPIFQLELPRTTCTLAA